jgi:hypothetical protein
VLRVDLDGDVRGGGRRAEIDATDGAFQPKRPTSATLPDLPLLDRERAGRGAAVRVVEVDEAVAIVVGAIAAELDRLDAAAIRAAVVAREVAVVALSPD